MQHATAADDDNCPNCGGTGAACTAPGPTAPAGHRAACQGAGCRVCSRPEAAAARGGAGQAGLCGRHCTQCCGSCPRVPLHCPAAAGCGERAASAGGGAAGAAVPAAAPGVCLTATALIPRGSVTRPSAHHGWGRSNLSLQSNSFVHACLWCMRGSRAVARGSMQIQTDHQHPDRGPKKRMMPFSCSGDRGHGRKNTRGPQCVGCRGGRKYRRVWLVLAAAKCVPGAAAAALPHLPSASASSADSTSATSLRSLPEGMGARLQRGGQGMGKKGER